MTTTSPRRVNLIPMAGAGQRFVDAGYTVPKPLIPIDGQPMVVRAAAALPPADQWIFLCRSDHIRDAAIDRELMARFAPATIISVDRLTEGQASTCLLAAPALREDDRLVIGACDNGMTYDQTRVERFWDEGADAIVWSFRGHPAVERNPRMYGWVIADEQGRVRGVSCKVPISANPLEDHAIVGAFAFRRASEFLRCARKTIALDRRVNGEFYMDTVLDQAAREGLDVRLLEVDRYVAWGTPQDLEDARP